MVYSQYSVIFIEVNSNFRKSCKKIYLTFYSVSIGFGDEIGT